MLLNKRKRNPGQNLTNNWVRVNNVSAKIHVLPPPPSSRDSTNTGSVFRIGKSTMAF